MIPAAEIKQLNPRDYWEIIWKRKQMIVVFVLIIVGVVTFYDFTRPKRYEAEVSIHIEKATPNIISEGQDGIYRKEVRDKEYYQSQYSLLKSHSLAERVIEKLGLRNDEEFSNAKNPGIELLSWVKIKPIRMSNIVIVSISGKDPLKITSIANTWAREFIYQDIEKRAGVAKYGASWLESQLSDNLKKIQEDERELNVFVKKNKLINIPDIEKEQDKGLLKDLETQKARLEKELAALSKKYKGKHPEIISLVGELDMVNQTIEKETEKFLNLQELSAGYKILKRKVDTSKSIYDNLLQRAKELDVSKELAVSNISIVDQAEVPIDPIWPKPKQDILFALVVSIFLSVGLCIFLEHLDSTLKTSDDVEFHTNMPFLGYIPAVKKDLGAGLKNLTTYDKPHSIVAEAFKNLRIALEFSFPEDKSLKTMVVTSAIPQEGKSFVSSNLAISFAQTGASTLLIDADMRKGKLVQTYKTDKDLGLSNLLAGASSLEETIFSTPIPNLSFISAGPYVPNPTELLGSAKLKELLGELEKRFKIIVIDSTPVLSVSEAILVGDKCNGLIFVVRAGYTPLNQVVEAKKILAKKAKIIGAILNSTEAEGSRYYPYHYYYSPEEKK